MAHPFPGARRALLAALLGLAVPWPSGAATTPGEPKDVVLRRSATGTVTAVDATGRQLTLQGRSGPAKYRVDPKVANLEQVKVGDRVKIDYVAAMVLTLKRAAKDAAPVEAQAVTPGQGGAIVATGTTVTARVVAVDRAAHTVRLKGPEGRVSEFRVQDQADLVGVRAGDRVVAVLHEAMVVGLEPVPR